MFSHWNDNKGAKIETISSKSQNKNSDIRQKRKAKELGIQTDTIA